MDGVCSTFVERISVYRVWWRNGGKETIWKPMRKWVDNIKVDLQEVGCVGMDWTELAGDRDN
jgi:hypothetical protein